MLSKIFDLRFERPEPDSWRLPVSPFQKRFARPDSKDDSQLNIVTSAAAAAAKSSKVIQSFRFNLLASLARMKAAPNQVPVS